MSGRTDERRTASNAVATRRPKVIARWLWLAAFVLIIFGAKLWFIDTAGSDLPFWDQWDAEGEFLFRPALEGKLTWQDILHPHNEHRIVTSKLYALGLLRANGQWDARLEMTCNALVHTFAALILLLLARQAVRSAWIIPIAVLLALLHTLPFSWENSLSGFQVAFYLLLVFSYGQIWLTLAAERFGWRWWLGQLCGLAALMTLASGLLSSVAILMVTTLRIVRARRCTAQQAVTCVVVLGFSIAGWLMKTDVPAHASLKATSCAEFTRCLAGLLVWPAQEYLPWAIVLLAPGLLFVLRCFRRPSLSTVDTVILALLLWVFLQCAATAYARGADESAFSSRYLDLFAVNVALGFLLLVREFDGGRRIAALVFWSALVLPGLTHETLAHWRMGVLPQLARERPQVANVRAYVRTNDSAHLLGKPWGEIPYPDGDVLLDRLSSPEIRRILPPSVRRPVDVGTAVSPTLHAVPEALKSAAHEPTFSTWALPLHSGTFTWRSAMQPATTLPVLRFSISGNLGAPGHHLLLVVKSASGETPVVPDHAPGNRWKTVNVFRPSGSWWLEASDADPHGWFAFSGPVEVGRLSWAAAKLLKYHSVLLWAGALFLVVGAGFTLADQAGAPEWLHGRRRGAFRRG
ncbi:hypothetical protein K0B96_03875 [Horticoccus luteus]|uniref:Uncharacterized protein n=1 Tax=Horticoccus luteus TaxID=2862869 RepID=A0A8F9XM09_9BACT|nr:hypothetical protein [Horticoccus luteus]QYM79766.1 hypothetical protein K0B96_03875 [Horticoccus luteus]